MPGPYGVTAAGFNPKTLAEQLAEIEIEEQAVFGAAIQLAPQTPLGQLNGVFADALAEMWEIAQDLYGSFDIDQAVGPRLDALGKLRRLARLPSQSDSDYRLALAQSDYGKTKTRRIRSILLNVPGVTAAQVIENSTQFTAYNGLNPHSLAISVVGGDDAEVASVIWENTVAGIGLQGNTEVQIASDGYCTLVRFIRPDEIPLCVEIDLSIHSSQCDCATEEISAIVSNLQQQLSGVCGMLGGTIITPAVIEQIVALNRGVLVEDIRMARDGETPEYQNVAFTLNEIPVIDPNCIKVNYVAYDGPTKTQGNINFGLAQGVIDDV